MNFVLCVYFWLVVHAGQIMECRCFALPRWLCFFKTGFSVHVLNIVSVVSALLAGGGEDIFCQNCLLLFLAKLDDRVFWQPDSTSPQQPGGLLCFSSQYHFVQGRVNFLGRPLHEPLSICSNPQQSGGLANVTKSLQLSNEWVKFKFWANYLFEALPASQK